MGQRLVTDALLATSLAGLIPGETVLVAEAGSAVPHDVPCIELGPDADDVGLMDALASVIVHRPVADYTVSREGASHLDMFRTMFATVAQVPACEVSHADFERLALAAKLVIVTGPHLRHPNVLVHVAESARQAEAGPAQ